MPPTASTATSLDDLHTHLQPGTPSHYLNRFIATNLSRRGVDSAEAGVLAEMERLLERHVQALFASAGKYAVLANRSSPNANDVLAAHSYLDPSHPTRRLRKESKKRRRAITLETVPVPAEVDEAILGLRGIMDETNDSSHPSDLFDVKPVLGTGAEKRRDEEERLPYAFDGAPRLPQKWTYASTPAIPTTPDHPLQVTSASLEFVKSTVAEANVDPELGIVHYRKRGGVDGAKRKWTVAA